MHLSDYLSILSYLVHLSLSSNKQKRMSSMLGFITITNHVLSPQYPSIRSIHSDQPLHPTKGRISRKRNKTGEPINESEQHYTRISFHIVFSLHFSFVCTLYYLKEFNTVHTRHKVTERHAKIRLNAEVKANPCSQLRRDADVVVEGACTIGAGRVSNRYLPRTRPSTLSRFRC